MNCSPLLPLHAELHTLRLVGLRPGPIQENHHNLAWLTILKLSRSYMWPHPSSNMITTASCMDGTNKFLQLAHPYEGSSFCLVSVFSGKKKALLQQMFCSPEGVVLRCVWIRDSRGPRPASSLWRFQSACTSCTSPVPPSNPDHKPVVKIEPFKQLENALPKAI